MPELAPAREGLGDGKAIPAPAPARLWQADRPGGAVVFGWSGAGRRATEACVARLAELQPRRVLHVGCAGALQAHLQPGDTFLIERVHHGDRSLDCPAEPTLRAALDHLRPGEAVSVSAIASPEQKTALASQHPDAGVVEMETFWAAEACQRHGLPLACVRVVLDPVGLLIPDLGPAIDAAGQVRPWAMARHLLRHPGDTMTLARLGTCMERVRPRIRDVVQAALTAAAASREVAD